MSNTYNRLEELFKDRYNVSQLVNVSEEDFRAKLEDFQTLREVGDFADPTIQRDQTVRFDWGHDHDFGSFTLKGTMGVRHLKQVAHFIDCGILPVDLSGKRILDVGVWTGGTSLLYAAMGAKVVHAVEEVPMYAGAALYLAESFRVEVDVFPYSLYELVDKVPGDDSGYDYVCFFGVLYHVSDPILALRLLYNEVKIGGMLLVETAGLAPSVQEPMLRYSGAQHEPSSNPERNRRGWNWFVPSQAALLKMMEDVGFESPRVPASLSIGRITAVGTKSEQRDMIRAGLSRRIP